MGAGQSTPPVKDRAEESCKRPWMRLRGAPMLRPQHPQRPEITVTRTITQETTTLAQPDDAAERCTHAQCPSLLTINSAAGLSPSGSPAGVALGIPAEHILDEDDSGFDGPVPRLTFSSPIVVSTVEAPATPSRTRNANNNGSKDTLNPLEVSPPSDSYNSTSPLLQAVQQLANKTQADARSRMKASARPAILNGGTAAGRNNDPDAITPAPPLDQKPCASEQVVDISKYSSDPDTCYFCAQQYRLRDSSRQLAVREFKSYLPCGHFFGNRCLFEWIVNRRQNASQIRCPHDCISLRHSCGHLTAPADKDPEPMHVDVSAATIPWVYKFCETSKGRKLRRNVERFQAIERVLERETRQQQNGRLRKVFSIFSFRRASICDKLHSSVKARRTKAEKELHRQQACWWINTWEEQWHIPITVMEE
ncbi:hypothetical protein ACHAQJ_005009 [Trichoderma viride]